MNAEDLVTVPLGVVTETSTMPMVELRGEVTTRLLAVRDVIGAAMPPKVTDVAAAKLAPVSVTVVPPALRPVDTDSDDTTGAGIATLDKSIA